MASVTFSNTVGGDGSTVSDDSNPTTGLGNGGHRTRLVPALAQIVAMATSALGSATAAAASALTAVNAPGTNATSTTNFATVTSGLVGTDVTFTIQSGKSIVPGMALIAARTSNPGNVNMVLSVKTYSGTSLVATVAAVVNTPSATNVADWTLSLTALAAAAVATTRAINTGGIATGGGDLSTNRTITVTKATAAEIMTGTADDRAVTPKALADAALIGTETDGTTVTPSFAGTFNRRVTLAGNRTIAAPTGCKEGMTYVLIISQDGTGGRTASWNSAYDWGLAGAPTLSAGASKTDIVFLYCYAMSPLKLAASFWKAG